MTEDLKKQVENVIYVAKTFPENLLGQHIYVYWSEDNVWYRAKVIRYIERSKKFKVVYDDKMEEKADLTQEWFIIEDSKLKKMAVHSKRPA